MKKGLGIGLGVVGLLVVVIMVFVSKYNNLVTKDEAVEAQWGNVENAYQKRMDLIPNLVKTVEGAADFERGTLTDVINARASATQTKIDPSNLSQADIDRYQQAQSGLGGALSRLLVSIERYPDLKANQNFLSLQSELSSIEQEILHERNKFNDKAKDFNTYRNQIPTNFVAAMFPQFNEKGYFKSQEGADQAPDVEFNFNENSNSGNSSNQNGSDAGGTNSNTEKSEATPETSEK